MSAPIAAADALITGALITGALGSAEPPPAPDARLVLVAGPELAGATGLAAALRERLPGCTVVEERVEEAIAGTVPAAVVFAVSAVAPLTESDCRLVDAAAADTDLVVGVVTKIDTHRGWREVLAADRELLARHDDRYRSVPWVGAAAAPDLGARRTRTPSPQVRTGDLDGPATDARPRPQKGSTRFSPPDAPATGPVFQLT